MKDGVLMGSVALGLCLLVAFTHAALHRPSGWEVAFDLLLLAVSCTWAIVRVAMGHPELPAVRVGRDAPPSYREADEPEVLVHRIPRATSVYRDAFFVALAAAVLAEVSLAAYAHFRDTDTTLALHVVLAIVLAVLVGFGGETTVEVRPRTRAIVLGGKTSEIPRGTTLHVERVAGGRRIVALPQGSPLLVTSRLDAGELLVIARRIADGLDEVDVSAAPGLLAAAKPPPTA